MRMQATPLTLIRLLPLMAVMAITASWLIGIGWPHTFSVCKRNGESNFGVLLLSGAGCFGLNIQTTDEVPPVIHFPKRWWRIDVLTTAGHIAFRQDWKTGKFLRVAIPAPLVITILLPLAVVSLRKMQFDMKSMFIWIAIVGVETGLYIYVSRFEFQPIVSLIGETPCAPWLVCNGPSGLCEQLSVR